MTNRIRQQVIDLFVRLENYHWSPDHPSTYRIKHPENGMLVGLGIIAMRQPGAFNLTYSAVRGALATMEDHKTAIALFIAFDKLVKSQVHGQELGDWLTMLSKEQFTTWVQDARNNKYLPISDIRRISDALQLHEVRRI